MDISCRNAIVLENILPYLDKTSILMCSSVSKHWYEMINSDNILWKNVCNSISDMDPEYWDWQDDDVWILGVPCSWKRCFMNYFRTAYNFKRNKFKEFNVNMKLPSSISYNGKLLNITELGKKNSLLFYKLINNNLELIDNHQMNFLNDNTVKKSCIAFSSNYIVYKKHYNVFYIYKLLNQKLYFDYAIYVSDKSNNNNNNIVEKNIESYQLFGTLIFRFDVFINKLYFEVLADRCIYIWNLEEKKLIFKLINYKFIKHDQNCLFLINTRKDMINVYNRNIELICSIQLANKIQPWILSDNNNIIIIENIFLNKIMIRTWNKLTCKLIKYELKKKSFGNYSKFFYVKSNTIVCLITHCEWIKLIAYNLDDTQQLWSYKYNLEPVHSCETFSVLRKIFVFKYNIIFGNSQLNLINVHNSDNGNILYSIVMQRPSIVLDIFPDMITYADKNGFIKVRLYR
ncbi:hypothetical protein O3M35_003419 [Rhynocoris fuscipes]|uniref:F-box domain-containing protein n=1 Tax=Rhynocoris fuscipes TaxID=488301 RepID=A0AAW1CRH9_9HEMI